MLVYQVVVREVLLKGADVNDQSVRMRKHDTRYGKRLVVKVLVTRDV